MLLIKSKFPANLVKFNAREQNYKTHTESVHPGKPAREKLKWAVFDLFKIASKQNVDEVPNIFTSKKTRIYTMENNQHLK